MSIREWILGPWPEEIARLAKVIEATDAETEALAQAWTEKERSLDRQLDRLQALTEEIDERIDRGNKIWRAIRARERREEVAEDGEDPRQLHLLDGEGSGEEGMPSVHQHVEIPGRPVPAHKEIARQMARNLIGG